MKFISDLMGKAVATIVEGSKKSIRNSLFTNITVLGNNRTILAGNAMQGKGYLGGRSQLRGIISPVSALQVLSGLVVLLTSIDLSVVMLFYS